MKTRQRKRAAIKNFSDQNSRPSRQFLNAVNAVIAEGEEIISSHPYWYSDVRKVFNSLASVDVDPAKKSENAFNDVVGLVSQHELNRAQFVMSKSLNDKHQNYRKQAGDIRAAIENIRSGKTLQQYKDEAAKLNADLNYAQRKQADVVMKRNADHIFIKINKAKSDYAQSIEAAKNQLGKLQAELENLINKCCAPSIKINEQRRKISMQEEVIKHLETSRDDEMQKIIGEIMATHTPVPQAANGLEDLQRRYDSARANAKFLEENFNSLLAQKQLELKNCNMELSRAVRAINMAAMKHYSSLDAKTMHGIIRLYARFDAYKTAFDFAVSKYIKDKDKVSSYTQKLIQTKTTLERLMGKLWYDDERKLSAMEIYKQFLTLPQAEREKLMNQKPDAAALTQILNPQTAKPSTVSIFKKPAAPETVAKRAFLKREPRQTFKG